VSRSFPDLPVLSTSRELRLTVSSDTDPYINFGLEEITLRSVEDGRAPNTLWVWKNEECLVRGRVRSPRYGWYNEELAKRLGVPVFERLSGGGVVYQDLGNLNWSFFLKTRWKPTAPVKIFGSVSQVVVDALRSIGIPADFVGLNRIEVEGRKVSGLAAHLSTRALLVHGTLLIRSNLRRLNELCAPPPGFPPVSNLSEWNPDLSERDLVGALSRTLLARGVNLI
jgi:lipoate-protein ligase A